MKTENHDQGTVIDSKKTKKTSYGIDIRKDISYFDQMILSHMTYDVPMSYQKKNLCIRNIK